MGVGKPIFFIDFCNYIVYNLMILFRLQRGTYMENNVTSGNILKHIAFFCDTLSIILFLTDTLWYG